jgi:membrane protein DedA with SNARE-associated domain
MFSLLVSFLSTQHWLARLGSSASSLIASFGGPGVLLLAIGDSSFLSLPEGNDLLVVVLSTGRSWGHMVYFVGMTVIGSLLGCLLLYSVGRKGGSPMLRRKFSRQNIERAERLFEKYGVMAVAIPSILPPPMPFKIFVLSAGVFRLRAVEFFTAVAIGRTLRYSMWGILAVLYGDSVKLYMQQNLNVIGMVLFGGFVLLAAVSLTYYLRRMKVTRSGKAS